MSEFIVNYNIGEQPLEAKELIDSLKKIQEEVQNKFKNGCVAVNLIVGGEVIGRIDNPLFRGDFWE